MSLTINTTINGKPVSGSAHALNLRLEFRMRLSSAWRRLHHEAPAAAGRVAHSEVAEEADQDDDRERNSEQQ